jgi:hypothetical protein
VQQLLAQQGLAPTLQDVVMYGIAMCTQRQAGGGSSCSSSAAAGEAPAPGGADGSSSMTARQAMGALMLFVQSLGKYGSGGAFMAPCYGTGALAEVGPAVGA